jgi:hypothetical protein
MKGENMRRLSVAILPAVIVLLWQASAVSEPISAYPGEAATMTLKFVNLSYRAMSNVRVEVRATRSWMVLDADKIVQFANLPPRGVGKSPTTLPLGFTVSEHASVGAEGAIYVSVQNPQGGIWTRSFQLKIVPRPKPTVPKLLQNFPNPFNPETWIPYQLQKPSHVEIQIYDADGQLVRALNLGFQQAGFYNVRSTAAYWDGRNDFGERVASGLYFYHLKTDHFTATRRMVIVK